MSFVIIMEGTSVFRLIALVLLWLQVILLFNINRISIHPGTHGRKLSAHLILEHSDYMGLFSMLLVSSFLSALLEVKKTHLPQLFF